MTSPPVRSLLCPSTLSTPSTPPPPPFILLAMLVMLLAMPARRGVVLQMPVPFMPMSISAQPRGAASSDTAVQGGESGGGGVAPAATVVGARAAGAGAAGAGACPPAPVSVQVCMRA